MLPCCGVADDFHLPPKNPVTTADRRFLVYVKILKSFRGMEENKEDTKNSETE